MMLAKAAAAVISPAPCRDHIFRPVFHQRVATRCVLCANALKRFQSIGDPAGLLASLEFLSIAPINSFEFKSYIYKSIVGAIKSAQVRTWFAARFGGA